MPDRRGRSCDRPSKAGVSVVQARLSRAARCVLFLRKRLADPLEGRGGMTRTHLCVSLRTNDRLEATGRMMTAFETVHRFEVQPDLVRRANASTQANVWRARPAIVTKGLSEGGAPANRRSRTVARNGRSILTIRRADIVHELLFIGCRQRPGSRCAGARSDERDASLGAAEAKNDRTPARTWRNPPAGHGRRRRSERIAAAPGRMADEEGRRSGLCSC